MKGQKWAHWFGDRMVALSEENIVLRGQWGSSGTEGASGSSPVLVWIWPGWDAASSVGGIVAVGCVGGWWFFWEEAVFPLALRHPSCPIGWWGAGELAWGRHGSARAREEADDGITGGNGMVEPRCQVYHPDHSNSHIIICQFLPFFKFLSTTMMQSGNEKEHYYGTAAAPLPLLFYTICLNINGKWHGWSRRRVLGQQRRSGGVGSSTLIDVPTIKQEQSKNKLYYLSKKRNSKK